MAGLLSQQPIGKLFTEPSLSVFLLLNEPLLSFNFTIVILVLVRQSVVNKHVFTIDDSYSRVYFATLTTRLVAKSRLVRVQAKGGYRILLLRLNLLWRMFVTFEVPKHRAWDRACAMIFKSFFELQFDLFIVGYELLLVNEDHALRLLLIKRLKVNFNALLLLFRNPVLFFGIYPLR